MSKTKITPKKFFSFRAAPDVESLIKKAVGPGMNRSFLINACIRKHLESLAGKRELTSKSK